MTDREIMQMALEALESGLAFSTHSPVLQALRAQLEQPEEKPVADVWTGCGECDSIFGCHDGKARCIRMPVEQQAEPSQWRDMVVVSLVREGVNKHKARELADHFGTPPQRKPLSDDMVHRAMLALNTASCKELQPTFDEMKLALEAAHGIKETP